MAVRKPFNFILAAALVLSLSGCYRLPDGPPEAPSVSQSPTTSQPEVHMILFFFWLTG